MGTRIDVGIIIVDVCVVGVVAQIPVAITVSTNNSTAH